MGILEALIVSVLSFDCTKGGDPPSFDLPDPKSAAPAHVSTGRRSGSDFPRVELPSDGVESCTTGRLELAVAQ